MKLKVSLPMPTPGSILLPAFLPVLLLSIGTVISADISDTSSFPYIMFFNKMAFLFVCFNKMS